MIFKFYRIIATYKKEKTYLIILKLAYIIIKPVSIFEIKYKIKAYNMAIVKAI